MLVLKVGVPSIMFYDVHPLIDNTFLSGLHKKTGIHIGSTPPRMLARGIHEGL